MLSSFAEFNLEIEFLSVSCVESKSIIQNALDTQKLTSFSYTTLLFFLNDAGRVFSACVTQKNITEAR